MKIIISAALLTLSVLTAVPGPASACDDCDDTPTFCGQGY